MLENAEFENIVQEVINRITNSSVDIADVEIITTDEELQSNHVNTLPGATSDGTIVQVALDVLAKPGRVAAQSANSAANRANAAAQAAQTSQSNIETKFEEIKDSALNVIEDCEAATNLANTVADNIGNHKLLIVTEEQYDTLLNGGNIVIGDKTYSMDSNTIYFSTEEDAT